MSALLRYVKKGRIAHAFLYVMPFVFAALLSVNVNAQTEPIPELPEISEEVAAADSSLLGKRAALINERNALRDRVNRHNAVCDKKMEEGSAEYEACLSAYQGIAADVNSHIKASKNYIGAYNAAVRQIKSVEGHSKDAVHLDKDPMSDEARKGFDTAGEDRGAIVVPKISGTMPTLLDKQVPEKLHKRPDVKKMLDWYRHLEGKKAEVAEKIATLKKQQETSKDPLLAVKIEQHNNELKKYASDQAVVTQNARKLVKDLGFGWNEIGETKQQEGAKK